MESEDSDDIQVLMRKANET
jgi:predicted SPOUT superfamily RNA methylase MTH1